MIHSQIYKHFEEYLPDRARKVTEYFPNGKNSIRVRQANKQEFIFSFNGPKAWRFETVEQFLACMRGEKKHG